MDGHFQQSSGRAFRLGRVHSVSLTSKTLDFDELVSPATARLKLSALLNLPTDVTAMCQCESNYETDAKT